MEIGVGRESRGRTCPSCPTRRGPERTSLTKPWRRPDGAQSTICAGDERRGTVRCDGWHVPLDRGRSSGTCHPSHRTVPRSEEHTSELQSQSNLVCRLLLEKKKKKQD